MRFVIDNWQFLSAITIAAWTVTAFWLTRRREDAWKRTQFMFEQLRIIDTDPGMIDAIAIIEGLNAAVSLKDVFSEKSPLSPEAKMRYLGYFDRLLNLLWCVSYAHLDLKTITVKELGGFGWYLSRVQTEPVLAEYCKENGFAKILEAADKLSRVEEWEASETSRARGAR